MFLLKSLSRLFQHRAGRRQGPALCCGSRRLSERLRVEVLEDRTVLSTLAYSTFLGGSSDETGWTSALDAAGNIYVTGTTESADFPTTPGAFDTSFNGGRDAFVAKFDPRGALVYSTFLGSSGFDQSFFIAVDDNGNAYVTGETDSDDFPTTPDAFDSTHNGGFDAIVAMLNPRGSALVYSTYLGGGGEDSGYTIALNNKGNAYVTGPTDSSDFPTTRGAFDSTHNGDVDAFVTTLNTRGSALVYSTYVGGSEFDNGVGIFVDKSGNAYVTGSTNSANFPTMPGAFDRTYNGGRLDDAFVIKLNVGGTKLVYSTFLGGNGDDNGAGIAVDEIGNAYVAGFTDSHNFPTTPGAFDRTYNHGGDAFVTKLNAHGSALVYSTYLGGRGEDGFPWIAVDADGNAYVTGRTDSDDFPTTPGAFDSTHNGDVDAFVTKLNTRGSALVYSTYLGGSGVDEGLGIAVDNRGNVYVTGDSESDDFPTTPGAFDRSHNGGFDAFVIKLCISADNDGEDLCRPHDRLTDIVGQAFASMGKDQKSFRFGSSPEFDWDLDLLADLTLVWQLPQRDAALLGN